MILYSQAELGAMIGASRESVARALARLRAEGLVESRRRGLALLDVERLRRPRPLTCRSTPRLRQDDTAPAPARAHDRLTAHPGREQRASSCPPRLSTHQPDTPSRRMDRRTRHRRFDGRPDQLRHLRGRSGTRRAGFAGQLRRRRREADVPVTGHWSTHDIVIADRRDRYHAEARLHAATREARQPSRIAGLLRRLRHRPAKAPAIAPAVPPATVPPPGTAPAA